MNKFKIGDKIICLPGMIEIWITPGKEYIVLDIVTEPARPPTLCYRDCGHHMHDAQPEKYFVVVEDKEKYGKATIFEGCFKFKHE